MRNVETTTYYEAIHQQLFSLSLVLKATHSKDAKLDILDFRQCNFSDLLASVHLQKSYLKLDAVMWCEFSLPTKKTGQSAKDRKYYKSRGSVFTYSEDEIKPLTNSFFQSQNRNINI